jgi:uncharacterized membrane protein
MTGRPHGERRYWLDDPRNVTRIVWALVTICVLLFFADAFYHKHAAFPIEQRFGFYAVFGFAVYVGLVLTAKALRRLLKRPENYYDSDV